MLLDIMLRCLSRLQEKDAYGQKKAEANALANDIMASIPFHVADNVESIADQGSVTAAKVNPGKAVGGLLLMHPLYVAANLSIVPPHLQLQMRECLTWIGEHMGIGQATVFSKVSSKGQGGTTRLPALLTEHYRLQQHSQTTPSFKARSCSGLVC